MKKEKFRTIRIANRSFEINTERLKAITKYAILTMCGFLLFRAGQAAAFEQRGYIAYGGEYLLLGLPLYYYIISATAREFAVEINNLYENGGYDND
jgi:drug/metabolite transporter superfamily protein YnfA